MDAPRRLAQPAAATPGAHGKDFREDREGRLVLRVGTDVEPARAADALELLLLDTRGEQSLTPALLVSPRAERPEVERFRRECTEQRGLVELVVRTTTAVWWSGWTWASVSSGQATISSSAEGMRSRVANFARASATMVVHPRSFAAAQSASAVSTAP